jgi:bifunctional polynucleotide phosphatase/kinase
LIGRRRFIPKAMAANQELPEGWVLLHVGDSTVAHRPPAEWGAPRPLCGYDFDGTLKRFRRRGPSAADARKVLQSHADAGDLVVVFTNRSASAKLDKQLAAPAKFFAGWPNVAVFAALDAGIGRKPCTGMFDAFLAAAGWENNPRAIAAVKEAGFYCGDAAGRDARGCVPPDFSAGDRFFAHNLGLEFRPPPGRRDYPMAEDYTNLLDELEQARTGDQEYEITVESAAITNPAIPTPGTPTLVLMAGPPASGKSTFARAVIDRWQAAGFPGEVVSRDRRDADGRRVGSDSKAKALKRACGELQLGNSVVLDNTHRKVSDLVEAAVKAARAVEAGPLRIVVAASKVSPLRSRHLDGRRVQAGREAKRLPRVAFGSYWKNREDPADAPAAIVAAVDEILPCTVDFVEFVPLETADGKVYLDG